MKRLLVFIVLLTLLVITGTLVSAEGQTRWRHKLTNSISRQPVFEHTEAK